MENCIFCKIIRGEIPSYKIWENDDFISILDINPNIKGTTLVISKEHYNSYLFDKPDNIVIKSILAAKETSEILRKGLKVRRVGMAFDGTGINHLHLKLYPMHGLKDEFDSSLHDADPVFYESFPGFITSRVGPQADFDELEGVRGEILRNSQ